MNFKKALFLVLLLGFSSLSYGQYSLPNIDFESGLYIGWQYYTGKVATGPVYTLTPCAPISGLHTLTGGSDTDFYGGFPIVGDGHFSLKLGNESCGWKAQRARYTIHVPTGTSIYNLLYRFAVVLQDAIGHLPSEQPRMEMTTIDSATGHIVACDSISFVASSLTYGFIYLPVHSLSGDHNLYYLPWTAASIDRKSIV